MYIELNCPPHPPPLSSLGKVAEGAIFQGALFSRPYLRGLQKLVSMK